MKLPLQFLDPPAILPGFHRTGRPRPLRVASSNAAVMITVCSRATAVHRGLPAPDPLAKASARQRSNVATLTPTSRDTCSTAALSGGSNRATIRSLYACPYRATSVFQRPQWFRSYLGSNLSDTEGFSAALTFAASSFGRPCLGSRPLGT